MNIFTTLGSAALAALLLGSTATADPALNRCWGEVRSQLNDLDTPEGTNGGAGGQHSRSTTAATINGGFAASNGFGITFNEENADGNHGRAGVGNASVGSPHFGEHGNTANGQHAVNNSNDPDSGAGFANILDPVTGDFLPIDENGDVITNGDLQCSLTEEPV